MENTLLQRGARIILKDWMNVRAGEALLIITDTLHWREMQEVEKCALEDGARVLTHLVPWENTQNLQDHFHELSALARNHQVIIGATHYSLVTTELIKRAVDDGSRFLSLPMATNDGRSLLTYDFLTMDTDKSRFMAKLLLKYINNATYLQVNTNAGANFNFRKVGRRGSYFNGRAKDNKGFASSSFEVYVPIEEDQTFGSGVVNGSLGYLGKVYHDFNIRMEAGKLVEIQENEDGIRLKKYMESFHDERIYHAGEFGIGLNTMAQCEGNCYIEDESSYGTFHIGFGRNIALGGDFEANGHFDIVFREPSIFADNRQLVDKGVIIVPEPQAW